MRAILLVPLLAAAAIGIAIIDGESGLRTWIRLRHDLAEARTTIEALRTGNDRLAADVASLDDDAFALERAIREDLGLGRPGEVLVHFGDSGVAWQEAPGPRGSETTNPRFP